jgi:histidinol dehydrogenase
VRVSRLVLGSDGAAELRELAAQIRSLSPPPPDVEAAVSDILTSVRTRGDAAVVELTRRFDSEHASERLRVAPERIAAALRELDPEVREGLEVAIANVRLVSEAELTADVGVDLPQGQRVELKEMPVRRAGVYVPGGRAAYPSTVVMCCVPARVAGVEQLVVATPPGETGEANPSVLAACALCGVEEVYSMGGAQAVAALAFGTDSVEPVDLIVGPGSHYVQEAKRQVFGIVGIDGVAGPTELVVVADEQADPALVALDIAAQAEHGPDTLLAVLSDSDTLFDAVEAELDLIGERFDSAAEAPLALVRVPSGESAVLLANAIAPEHLELLCTDGDRLAALVKTSACVFVDGGAAFGDYAAGSNHVLPTGGAARYAGPLGSARFRRRQAMVSLPGRAAGTLASYVSAIAHAEGFPLHAQSATARERRGTPSFGAERSQ